MNEQLKTKKCPKCGCIVGSLKYEQHLVFGPNYGKEGRMLCICSRCGFQQEIPALDEKSKN